MKIGTWCSANLGSPVSQVLFRAESLSKVVGVHLADGREVVVKIRPRAERLEGCATVHHHLWTSGFPCPELLVGPVPFEGSLVASAEEYVPGGQQLRGHPECYAMELARLVDIARTLPDGITVDPPPWAAWDHSEAGTWPVRDDDGPALTANTVPAWLDAIGQRARERLSACGAPPEIGHADWESQNLRWSSDSLLVVHDWDSVATRPEPVLAGLAAAVHPANSAGTLRAGNVNPIWPHCDGLIWPHL